MSPRRPRSIEVVGVAHGAAPIPMGARVGNTLYSSGIPGIDPSTGRLAVDAASQARFAFDHMRSLLAGGGARPEDVVRMTVYLKDNAAREHVNAEWLKCFPEPHDRPARHTLMYDLQGGMLLQLEVIAIVDDLRENA
jgi:2-iminobutanoate/2-iminopropanoate deaminase